jgi:hypothetical protein
MYEFAISQKLTELCAASEKTDAFEQEALKTHTSPALEKALLSNKTFWTFITDPDTPYLDRMAAATRGASALSPEDLHLLWEAMAEVELQRSGVKFSPCDYIRSANLTPLMWVSRRNRLPADSAPRVILGREIQVPEEDRGFPNTVEEREQSPWLWQLGRALPILFDNVNRYYGDASRYPLRVKAAWDWIVPIPEHETDRSDLDTWERVRIRSRALAEWAPRDVLLLQTVLKLALHNDNRTVPYSANVEALVVWGQDSYHLEELAHVGQIVILEKTKWEDVAERTAFLAAESARYEPNPSAPHIVPLKSATAILAIGKWARDSRVAAWSRYQFAGWICKMVDDPPFTAGELRDPEDPRLKERLRTFDVWFEKKKPSLEREAAGERPRLQALAKELGVDLD